jgi:hypothetical protein
MVYSNKFVMSVLLNGEPQKELANGVVKLPFGAEYVLRFRNKNNRRAMVKFTIDGENVSGDGYIIDANSHVDIRRHWDKDVGFKFVSLDSPDAVDFGKNGPNEDKVKGLVEAKFYLEKENKWVHTPVVEHHHHHHHYPRPRPQPWPIYPQPYWGVRNTMQRRMTTAGGSSCHATNSVSNDAGMAKLASFQNDASVAPCSLEASFNAAPETSAFGGHPLEKLALQDGCTVEGNTTGQTFRTVAFEAETDYVQLKVFLQGFEKKPEAVAAPSPKKVSAKSKQIADLEEENEKLRQQLAEIENEKLKKKLARAKKKAQAE